MCHINIPWEVPVAVVTLFAIIVTDLEWTDIDPRDNMYNAYIPPSTTSKISRVIAILGIVSLAVSFIHWLSTFISIT